ANESPSLLSPEAGAALAKAMIPPEWNRYPDARAEELRAAIAAHTGSSPDEILVGTGSDEIIALLLTAPHPPRPPAPPPPCPSPPHRHPPPYLRHVPEERPLPGLQGHRGPPRSRLGSRRRRHEKGDRVRAAQHRLHRLAQQPDLDAHVHGPHRGRHPRRP